MTTWIETSNLRQNGEPVTKRIRTAQLTSDIWFTDQGYAEIADDDVADILVTNIDTLSKVAEPSEPGTYYNEAAPGETMVIELPDGNFDKLTAETANIDDVVADAIEAERLNNTVYYLDTYTTAGDGTDTDKWIVDINDVLNDIPTDDPAAVIVVPPGSYEIQATVRMENGIRHYDEDDATGAWTYPTLTSPAGTEPHNVRLYAADGINDHLIEYDTSADMAAGDNVIDGGIRGLYLNGNKAGNTSGNILHFVDQTDNSNFVGGLFSELILRRAADKCLADPGGHLVETHLDGCIFNRAENRNVDIGSAQRLIFDRCEFNFAGNQGIQHNAVDSTFHQCRFRSNTTQGLVNLNNNNSYFGCLWIGNSTGASDDAQMQTRGKNNSYSGYVRSDGNGTDHVLAEDTDGHYSLSITEETPSVTASGAVRPRWEGVLWGGPFGGTDISTLTGAFAGERALTNGASAAPADVIAVYDGTDWVYPSRGGIVTPA